MHWKKSSVFALHLALSLCIFSLLLGIMLWQWYPGDLFSTAGGWQGLKIIAGVDLVLGPLLTLLFYRPNKDKVWLDLSLIACLQIAALVWGVHAVYQKHPAALVVAQNTLYAVSHEEYLAAQALLQEKGLEPAEVQALPLPEQRLEVIYATPYERQHMGRYIASVFNGWPELPLRTDRYQSFDHAKQDIEQLSLSLARREATSDRPEAPPEVLNLPYKSLYSQGTAQVSRETGQVLSLLPERP